MSTISFEKRPANIKASFEIHSIAFSPDRAKVALGGINGLAVEIVDVRFGKTQARLPLDAPALARNGVRWGRKGHVAAIHGVGSTAVRIWNGAALALDVDCKPYRGCKAIEFDDSGRWLAITCASNPKTHPVILIVDMDKGELKEISAPLWPRSLAWLDGQLVAAGNVQHPLGLGVVAIDVGRGGAVNTMELASDASISGAAMASASVALGGDGQMVAALTIEGNPRQRSAFCRLGRSLSGDFEKRQEDDWVEGKADLIGFVGPGHVAFDFYDHSSSPIKLLPWQTSELSSALDIGKAKTNGAHAIAGDWLAMGLGKAVAIYQFKSC